VGFIPKTCNKDCVNIINGQHSERIGIGNTRLTKNERYRIPPLLIKELIGGV